MQQIGDPSPLEVSALRVDARGLACPIPNVRLAQALKTAPRVELWADDPAAQTDLRAFVSVTGHLLERVKTDVCLQALVSRSA